MTEIIANAPREGQLTLLVDAGAIIIYFGAVDYKTFLTILNRPDGFKPAGTPGMFHRSLQNNNPLIVMQRSSFEDSRCLIKRGTVLLGLES